MRQLLPTCRLRFHMTGIRSKRRFLHGTFPSETSPYPSVNTVAQRTRWSRRKRCQRETAKAGSIVRHSKIFQSMSLMGHQRLIESSVTSVRFTPNLRLTAARRRSDHKGRTDRNGRNNGNRYGKPGTAEPPGGCLASFLCNWIFIPDGSDHQIQSLVCPLSSFGGPRKDV